MLHQSPVEFLPNETRNKLLPFGSPLQEKERLLVKPITIHLNISPTSPAASSSCSDVGSLLDIERTTPSHSAPSTPLLEAVENKNSLSTVLERWYKVIQRNDRSQYGYLAVPNYN